METANKPLVLIVDDTPQNIQVLGNILYSKGYNISISSSGAHALQSINTNAPDLILLDIQMPEMDGYEVCEILKKSLATKDIPIIFLTAKAETADIVKGFELGAVDYITKPFNVAELTARVATHIELKQAREKVEALNKKLYLAYDNIQNSINYAKIIQEGMLPDLNILQTKGIQHMLIYKPKDVISGDFYWTEIVNTHPLTPSRKEGEIGYGYYTTDSVLYKLLKDKAEAMRNNPTKAESVLWKFLKANQTDYHFRRQHIIDRFIVDFVCLKKRLIIEVDGDIHDYQIEEDNIRTSLLNDNGFNVIRFKNEEVLTQPEVVISKIKAVIEQGLLPPPVRAGVSPKVLPLGEDLGGEKIFLAVVDCTGHGVPGALLSMSGHNLLNEIINIEKVYDPAEILNSLNRKVGKIFKQEQTVIHDGMDIALCVFNMNSKTLEYTGANIPLWYFHNNVFKKLLPDKLTIGEGYFEDHKPVFTKQQIKFNSGDKFFMFTDGITDQFDKTGKIKFTKKKFEQQLISLADQPMDSLKNNLMEFLSEWQGDYMQTDDILMLGIEIKK